MPFRRLFPQHVRFIPYAGLWKHALSMLLLAESPCPAAPAADSAGIGRAVRRLDAAAAADREAAERELVAAGTAALETVVSARTGATGEAAFRLEWIQRELERRAAAAAVEPAIVSLAAAGRPARDLLADLFARTGNTLALSADVRGGEAGGRPVTLVAERETFWEAVDGIVTRAGLAINVPAGAAGGGAGAVEITAGPPPRLPAVAAGPARIAVVAVEPLGRAEAGRNRGARIILRCMFEPRLAPLLVRLPARSIVAEGPAGEAMPAAQRTAVMEAAVPNGRPWVDLPVSLAAAADPLESLGLLRGSLEVWLAGREHVFRLAADDAAGGRADRSSRRVAAAEARLLECSIQGERLSVRAAITYDAASEALASHHPWLAARLLAAVRSDGTPLPLIEQRVESRSDRGLVAAAWFASTAVDRARLHEIEIRWQLPVAIHQLPIDFAIRAVPLPVTTER